jgi:hypothetical protein
MTKSEIIGTWKFVTMVAKTGSGKTLYPYGEKLFGRLMYTPDGHMSALLMDTDRDKFASNDPLAGTLEEIKQAYKKFDAYCGTYKVDENKESITHHVEGAKFPNWVGTDQLRYFELKGDRLEIKATIEIEGENWHIEAVLIRALKS